MGFPERGEDLGHVGAGDVEVDRGLRRVEPPRLGGGDHGVGRPVAFADASGVVAVRVGEAERGVGVERLQVMRFELIEIALAQDAGAAAGAVQRELDPMHRASELREDPGEAARRVVHLQKDDADDNGHRQRGADDQRGHPRAAGKQGAEIHALLRGLPTHHRDSDMPFVANAYSGDT